jgi:hypothetical protein
MRALSLWQPWATLLVGGRKRIETRSWPLKHRGPLLIHAAKKWNADLSALCVREPFKDALECLGVFHVNPFTQPPGLPFGAIVGRVNIVGCVLIGMTRTHYDTVPGAEMVLGHGDYTVPPDEPERAFGDYTPGRYAILCDDPVRFAEPIPFAGHQGLFDVPDGLLESAPWYSRGQ